MIITENTFQFLIKIAAVTAALSIIAVIATMLVLILRDGNTPLVIALDNDLVTILQYSIAAFVALLAGHGVSHIVTAAMQREAAPTTKEGKI